MAFRLVSDIVFNAPLGYRPITLDVHLPAEEGAPLIVFVHGGGWRTGSRRVFVPNMVGDAFDLLTRAGFAVASVDYRLAAEAVFPAQRDDVANAVAWLREHANDYGYDGTRVVLWGESAGGTLAALAGLGDPEIRGVVDWYGPTDITAMATALGQLDDASTREAGWIGGSVADKPLLAREASPINHVHRAAPPFHIAHGLSDTAVPHEQSEAFAAALAQAGVEVEFELVPEAGHMWSGEVDRIRLLNRALAFVSRVTS